MTRALPRSYGDISTLTLSPTLIRMKFLRIFPEMCASTSCPFGSDTRNIVPGSTCVTVPVSSIGSSFGTRVISCRKPRCRQPPKCAPTVAMGTTSASVSRRSGRPSVHVPTPAAFCHSSTREFAGAVIFRVAPLTDCFGRRGLWSCLVASTGRLRFQTCRTGKRFHDVQTAG